MNLEEFESHTHQMIEQTLNQLHTAALMVAHLETQISEAGRNIQVLSQQLEAFVSQQRQSASEEAD